MGLGAVGRALRWRLNGLGVSVIAYDPYHDEARHSLEELLEQADIVSLHAPVTDATVGMIGAEAVRGDARRRGVPQYGPRPAARHRCAGRRAAKRQGGGGGPGPFRGEWLPVGHPLTALPNVVLTPHIGGATWNTELRQAQMVADGLEALLADDMPANIVNPEVLAR